jgi:hypothetical protein
MMIKISTALMTFSLLSGCAVPAVAVYAGTRVVTERHAGLILAETHPELPNTTAAVCVIDGMTRAEVLRFGSTDTSAVTAAHRATIAEVVARPKVTSCLADLGTPAA